MVMMKKFLNQIIKLHIGYSSYNKLWIDYHQMKEFWYQIRDKNKNNYQIYVFMILQTMIAIGVKMKQKIKATKALLFKND